MSLPCLQGLNAVNIAFRKFEEAREALGKALGQLSDQTRASVIDDLRLDNETWLETLDAFTNTEAGISRLQELQNDSDTEEEEEEEEEDLSILAAQARGEDQIAKKRLEELAIAAGYTAKEVDEVGTWVEVVEMIQNPKNPKPTATQAVIAFVKEHPGVLISEIVQGVRGKFVTTSSNPDKMVYSIIAQCVKNGTLLKANERFFIPA